MDLNCLLIYRKLYFFINMRLEIVAAPKMSNFLVYLI